jgi:serine/threonine protein kinase
MPDFGALEEDKRGELVIRIITTTAQAEAAARARDEEAKTRERDAYEAAAAIAQEEAAARAREEMEGVTIGQYRITGTIGRGGMGVVYAGAHVLLGRQAAIKVLLPELSQKQDMVMRFFNEAKAATAIRHPGIVEIYDFGWSGGGCVHRDGALGRRDTC